MDSESNQAHGNRRLSGEFPQPISPWESRGLLLAEVLVAAVVAGWLLAGGLVPEGMARVETGAPQQVVEPMTRVAITVAQAHP